VETFCLIVESREHIQAHSLFNETQSLKKQQLEISKATAKAYYRIGELRFTNTIKIKSL
jgi:hypothetical protein